MAILFEALSMGTRTNCACKFSRYLITYIYIYYITYNYIYIYIYIRLLSSESFFFMLQVCVIDSIIYLTSNKLSITRPRDKVR